MRLSLRNVKLVFSVNCIPLEFQNRFKLHRHNLIMRIFNNVILTIYLSQIHNKRIHVTGLRSKNQKEKLLRFLGRSGIGVDRIQINSSFFLLEGMNIPEYNKFGYFCSKYKRNKVSIDLSSFNVHENFLCTVYLRVLHCTGVANIHRKSIVLLACRKKCCVDTLTKEIRILLISFAHSLLI